MKLQAENLREFVELARSRIEIKPKVLCISPNLSDSWNVPHVMKVQFIIEFSSNLLRNTLIYKEISADGVSVEIDTGCYTDKGRIEIAKLMNDLKNKAALRFEELTNLFKERQIEVVLYDPDGTVRK